MHFEVHCLEGYEKKIYKIYKIEELSKKFGNYDVILFYIAAHSVDINGKKYFVSSGESKKFKSESLSLDDVGLLVKDYKKESSFFISIINEYVDRNIEIFTNSGLITKFPKKSICFATERLMKTDTFSETEKIFRNLIFFQKLKNKKTETSK